MGDSTQADLTDFRSVMMGLGDGTVQFGEVPEHFVEMLCQMMKRTRAELEADYAAGAQREAAAPGVGDAAPDFALELLSADGDHTGDMRRLSDFRGKPVALAFGSYT